MDLKVPPSPPRPGSFTPPAQSQPSTPAAKRVSFASVEDTAKGQRVVLYGTGGIGKTTLACLAPGPIAFIDLDESLPVLKKQLKENSIPVPSVVTCHNWQEVRDALKADGWDKIKTIVIDTGTKLEEFATAHTLKTVKTDGNQTASSVEGYGYGKGFQFVYDTFQNILGDLDAHIRAGRNVIIICHECTANVPNPDGEDWIRYEPRLQSPSSGKASIRLRMKEWADHVLFISYDVAVNKEGKAQGGGTRTLRTAERPFCMAKSRTTAEQFDVNLGDGSIWEKIFN